MHHLLELGGYGGRKHDRRFIYSRFRQTRTFRDAENSLFTTTVILGNGLLTILLKLTLSAPQPRSIALSLYIRNSHYLQIEFCAEQILAI